MCPQVRPGTNGAVTGLGTLASVAGGAFVGTVFYATCLLTSAPASAAVQAVQWRLVPLGAAAGLLGSVIDSVLGGTLQFSGFDTVKNKVVARDGPNTLRISGLSLLDNDAVNVVR